jgi:adenosylcobinamide kinase/adenosylcobinamide-phosphate guanylyltransferase
MLHLIIGPPFSGKSLHAERLLDSAPGSTVYLGTLPDAGPYRETIRRHRQRRPAHWALSELQGDPAADLEVAARALCDYRNVLLDGLTFYLFRLMTLFDLDLAPLRGRFDALAAAAARRDGQVVVCDSHVSNLLSADERLPLRYMHAALARRADTVTFFRDGAALEIGRSRVLRLDRLWPDASADPRRARQRHGEARAGPTPTTV